jgi:hypothetical protein
VTLLLIAVGLAVLFWPSKQKGKSTGFDLSDYELDPPPAGEWPSFPESIGCLANVRDRLEKTEELSSIELESIDVITLALVRGSGK